MAIFKELTSNDIKSARSYLTQLVDIIQEDISGSNTRRAYQVFVTGGLGPGVTSSLFQTVYDADFTLQTANPIFDITIGLHSTGSTVVDASTGEDSTGKLLFRSSSLMMREKIDMYRQHAQVLLGNASSVFVAPFDSANDGDKIHEALFLDFKRLFARDQIKRETFAMRFFTSASDGPSNGETNLFSGDADGAKIFTDAGAATNKLTAIGGQVSEIVDSADTTTTVGLMFSDHGIAVLDITKITSASQHMSGAIHAVITGSDGVGDGMHAMGGPYSENPDAKLVPDFLVSASMDDIIDHFGYVRFSSGTNTAISFQNVTNINSTLVFCRATADEFNYSSNPTYTDSDNRIVVIDEGQEDTQNSFTFVTSVGMYDANDNLLAVAKLSRPVEKNAEKDLTFRCRLDY